MTQEMKPEFEKEVKPREIMTGGDVGFEKAGRLVASGTSERRLCWVRILL